VAGAGSSGTASAGQTTIVIQGSGATGQPGQTAVAANPSIVSSSTVAAAAPTPAPTVAAQPTAAPSGGVAGANPAIVNPTQRITAGSWNFVWNYGLGALKAIGTATYGGTRPTRGQWVAVTFAAANTSGQPTQIPDGFFVLKDSQNRVYDFNRKAAIDWFNRFGGRGNVADQSAGDPFTRESVSTILLFDVPTDATNLVFFSRDNLGQGYQIK
jgi:hypothetical protein